MSSSSRSIAAARSRRAGESQPPVSGGRPGTSIASHSAFVQQQMPPPPSNNVRIAKAPMQQQQQQQQQQVQGGLPFSKLSVSDAIGLITLRLGRIEQFVMESENDDVHSQSKGNIPENSKIVDNSVLTTIINRLDSLEKREGSNIVASSIASSVASLEKELKETKDLLSHLLFKFELFSKETNEKFGDFEGAITEIEKNMESQQFVELNDTMSATLVADETSVVVQDDNISLTTIDLKNLIKQEFSASESANK
jgi:hypothetical protein